MISAIAMMCALAAQECHTSDASRIARAIDVAVEDDRLRALLVVYAHHESGWQLNPPAHSWDAKAGRSCGTWQQRCDRIKGHGLVWRARAWLQDVQASSLGGVDSSPSRAMRRVAEAEKVLDDCAESIP